MKDDTIAKQLLSLQKTAFDTACQSLDILNESAEKTADRFLNYSEGLLKDAATMSTQCFSELKKAHSEYGKNMKNDSGKAFFDALATFQLPAEKIAKSLLTQSGKGVKRSAEILKDASQTRKALSENLQSTADTAYKICEEMLG